MRVAFLNTFYPPDAAITGVAMAEVVGRLRSRHPDIEVRVFAGSTSYGAGPTSREGDAASVTRIGTPAARGKLERLIRSILLGRRMAAAAAGWADVIVSLTDPPLLGYWIGRRRRAPTRWIEWTMDLYPEAFAAAGLVAVANPLVRLLQASQRRHAPDAFICLGDAQAEAVRKLRADRRTLILPCGVPTNRVAIGPPPDWRKGEERVVLAYAGNLGEAHSRTLLPALVAAADPERFAFVLAVHGAHAAAVRAAIGDPANVSWLTNVDQRALVHADVHIASLEPAWTHLCVPSKAVSAICLGRPLLFAGLAESDTALMLGPAIWRLDVPANGVYTGQALAGALAEIADPEIRRRKTAEAANIGVALRQRKDATIEAIIGLITGSAAPGT